MAEYISKEDAIDFLNSKQLSLDSWGATEEAIGVIDARLIIKDMKPEDVVPVVHAKWVFAYGNEGQDNVEKCSNCGSHWKEAIIYTRDTREYLRTRLSYCPNCGAKMDKEED